MQLHLALLQDRWGGRVPTLSLMRRCLLTLTALSLLGCDSSQSASADGGPHDGQYDDAVVPVGKADSNGFEDRGYAATCILRVANGSDRATLTEGGVWSRAADAILRTRSGPDGTLGTADDVMFATLEELDDVDWIGYFAFSAMFDHAQGAGLCPGLGEEYEHAGEAEATDLIIRRIGERMQREFEDGARPATRGLHAKGRCLQAEVSIDNGELPAELRVGLFASNRTHPAWVRFSNGDPHVQADREGDVRAMAIKLLDVPGEKLLESEADATTHDFLLNHTPAVATADVIHFADVIDHAESGRNPALAFLDWNPFDIELDSILLAIDAITTPIINPLSTSYWSQTPYRLGPEASAVKYRARPCEGQALGLEFDDEDPNHFTPSMEEQLERGDVCFEFAVQRQTDPERMPIEDASIEWSTSESPFIPVARIVFSAQDFVSEEQVDSCEHFSFTPWHALPEHRPLGSLNRARKRAYDTISARRHGLNDRPRVEPNE